MDVNFSRRDDIESVLISCLRAFAQRGRQLRKAHAETEEPPTADNQPGADESEGEKTVNVLGIIESNPNHKNPSA